MQSIDRLYEVSKREMPNKNINIYEQHQQTETKKKN